MNNPQIETFIRQIRDKLPTYDTPEQAAEAVRTDIESLGMIFSTDMIENLSKALHCIQASFENVEILRRNSLIKKNDKWYNGPSHKDIHWPALKSYLSEMKHWDDETIASIDQSSSEVLSLLANPKTETFRHRGLVVGYVQSGKTANMTAVIAKAVDAGYNLIVLLGGMTNKLRTQTQGRVENDIVNRHRHLWQLYTTSEEGGDYTYPPNRSFTMPIPGYAQLVVMKKVASRLETFRKTIVDDKGKPKTPLTILRKLKVLIIDDECDQASVNSSSSDYDITRINEEIRKIIRSLPAVSYVGYTATPFANVFIDPYSHGKDALDDLYPEDFITALPRSKGYFGAREVFGFDPNKADEETVEEAGRNMIRNVPEETLDLLRPARRGDKDEFYPQLTKELESSILWFLITCAIRRERGHIDKHMTMLVHTSPYVSQHENMAKMIKKWISSNKIDVLNNSSDLSVKMRDLFQSEIEKVPLEYNKKIIFSDIINHFKSVFDNLEIVVENGESFERLNYETTPKTYIVVGGTVLARGLTLEGLSVSFFLRTSMQYDTLLQMGRWFGYRPQYEDLPRLWTTSELASRFRSLAHIEEEIREDISNYKDHHVTPQDFAVRVRAIPGMAITAASKMRHAYRSNISFEGRHIQTIRYEHRQDDVISGNWKAAVSLVTSLKDKWSQDHSKNANSYLCKNVSLHIIRRFLLDYDISEHHMDLKKELLLGYIDKSAGHLKEWNVGIITPTLGNQSKLPLGPLGHVGTNNRAQLIPNEKDYADIKALMSKNDILIDADASSTARSSGSWTDYKKYRPTAPLLLLYVIDSKSPAKTSSKSRIDLDAAGDLIGIGIVFPGAMDRAGGYYSVELDAPMIKEDEDFFAEALEEEINEE
ncbi:Z1 domain-containing protein [Rahnella aquatilis]|jgi:hypothetical protein|nr:Z1 domain-containing protein [Rahnella aquatilis]